jgi:uncharacterized protein (TIGR00290 family)
MKIISSWSGGKDGAFACYRAMKSGNEVRYLLNFISQEYKRCCFHGTEARLLMDQARCAGIPMFQKEMSKDMEEYERGFKEAVLDLKPDGIEGMVFGDIYLDEHKEWVERVCSDIGVSALEPLWNMEPRRVIEEFLDEGFRAVVVSCKEELGMDFLGRELDGRVISELEKRGMCPCGENGEYHTLVTDGPIFKKKIIVRESEALLREGFWRSWFLDIKKYEVAAK